MKPHQTAAIILAAGRGTRMKSALPKVMHRIAGFPMIHHVVTHARAAGLSPICTVVAADMQSVADTVHLLDSTARIATQTEQLGTGHAVLAAREALRDFQGNLLVLYGDTPLLTTATMQRVAAALEVPPPIGGRLGGGLEQSTEFVSAPLPSSPREGEGLVAVAVLGFTPHNPTGYGRLMRDAAGNLERIVEEKDASAAERAITLCNSGVMALRGEVAWEMLAKISNKNAKGEYYLTDIVEIARGMGWGARVVEGDAAEVLGVNSRNELAEAEAIFQTRTRAAHMANGVTLLDPSSVYFSADTAIAPDVLIEPNVFFGPGVRVETGAHIKAFSHIEGATIGAGAIVGPFARLRPGALLGEHAHIGNFVEIKNSRIDAGAKVNHLSYIGDSSVGAKSNIGAGTITCNYDGYHKYRTVIGANVFVGSHSTLIAPVAIGDGAFIAAGSVITDDVAPDALALARSRQEEKKDWVKGFRGKQGK